MGRRDGGILLLVGNGGGGTHGHADRVVVATGLRPAFAVGGDLGEGHRDHRRRHGLAVPTSDSAGL